MKQFTPTDYSLVFPRWRYRLLILAGGALIVAWAIQQVTSLALLTLTVFAAVVILYLAWARLTIKTQGYGL